MQNILIVGSDKSSFVEIANKLDEQFLFIDDGALLERLTIPEGRKVTRLDLSSDFYTLLDDITHRRAKEIARILYSSPDTSHGENTLTVRNGRRALTRLLRDAKTSRLDKLRFDRSDPGEYEAGETLKDILGSPVLKRFLSRPAGHTNFPIDSTILAKLDRTILSDEEAFIIANVLIVAYQGQVIVPDFGFYGRPFHTSLIRQGRLIAGVNYLDEVDLRLRQSLLLIADKRAHHCIPSDAKMLAEFAGLVRDPGREDCDFNLFVRAAVS